MDVYHKIDLVEERVAAIRDREFALEEGLPINAVHLHGLSVLRYRWTGWAKEYEAGRKMLDNEMMKLVDLEERIELGGLETRHQHTSHFDKKAWQDRCRGPFATPEEKAAIAGLDLYLAAEAEAKKTETIKVSAGIRVLPIDQAATAAQ